MTATATTVFSFEKSPWNHRTTRSPGQRLLVHVSREHIQQARWSRFLDPISLALRQHLSHHACADLFWNSDGFGPRHPGDEARTGIHHEIHDQATGDFIEELHYHLPLPHRAARTMWRLRQQGIETFRPFNMSIHLPQAAPARNSQDHHQQRDGARNLAHAEPERNPSATGHDAQA